MSDAPLDEVVPGERLQTPEGACYFVRREYPICHHHGGKPLELTRGVAGHTLAALARDEGLTGLTLDQACFLDTETTGLAGGTGTHVFMVGVGYFSGDHFRVDQYFMEDYDQEPGLVAALEEGLGGFEAVVSFNGKAFDLPLIETRFILSRKPPPLRGRPHLDLLPPSRRLWGHRLESCRLASLEEHVLGEARAGDIPSYLIPEHYFTYLRTRDPWYVKPVFDHNQRDVLSLLALAGRAAERFEAFLAEPAGPRGADLRDGRPADIHPLELFGLARLYRALGLHEPAVRCYRACLGLDGEVAPPEAAPLPDHLAGRAGLDCVRLLRRLGRAREAIALCERLADGYPPRLWALMEMAKDLEHRVRDHARALAVVDRAIGLLEAGLDAPGPGPAAVTAALEWRRARLARKLARRTGRAGVLNPRSRVIPPSAQE